MRFYNPIIQEMKKIIFYLTALFIAASVVSCGLVDFSNEDSYIDDPTAQEDGSYISISVSNYVGCKYINVIRYEVSGPTAAADKVDNTTFSIGQITPKNDYQKKNKNNYVFKDFYTDSAKYYQYYVQYMTSSGNVVSKTTGTVQGKGSLGEKIISINAPATSIRVDFNKDTGILEMDKDQFSIPESRDNTNNPFKLKVAITNKTLTQLFTLIESGDKYVASLKTLLPDNFIGKPLEIYGFVGEDEDKNGHYSSDEDDYYRWINYYWTKPLSGDKAMLYINQATTTSDNFTVSQTKDDEDTYNYGIEGNK